MCIPQTEILKGNDMARQTDTHERGRPNPLVEATEARSGTQDIFFAPCKSSDRIIELTYALYLKPHFYFLSIQKQLIS